MVAFLDLLGLQREVTKGFTGCRVVALQTALGTGIFIAVQSEMLGLFNLLAQPYVAITWGITLVLYNMVRLAKRLVVPWLAEINC